MSWPMFDEEVRFPGRRRTSTDCKGSPPQAGVPGSQDTGLNPFAGPTILTLAEAELIHATRGRFCSATTKANY